MFVATTDCSLLLGPASEPQSRRPANCAGLLRFLCCMLIAALSGIRSHSLLSAAVNNPTHETLADLGNPAGLGARSTVLAFLREPRRGNTRPRPRPGSRGAEASMSDTLRAGRCVGQRGHGPRGTQ